MRLLCRPGRRPPQTKESKTTKFKSRKQTCVTTVSESFQTRVGKVDYGKYIDQIQDELKRAIADHGPGRTQGEIEAIQARLQECIRKQSLELAKEVGFLRNQAFVFMLSNSIISTAWVAFTLKRETSDISTSPEDRLALMEMFDALANALADVIQQGSSYADTYGAAGSAARQEGEPARKQQ